MRALLAASCGVALIAPVAFAMDGSDDPQSAGQRTLAQLTSAQSSRDPGRLSQTQQGPASSATIQQGQMQRKQTATPSAPAQPVPQNWTAVFSTESRYFSWNNSFALPNGSPGHG